MLRVCHLHLLFLGMLGKSSPYRKLPINSCPTACGEELSQNNFGLFCQRVSGWIPNGYIPVEPCSSHGSGSWAPEQPIHPVGSPISEPNTIPLSDWPGPLHHCVFTADASSEAKREFVEARSSLCFIRPVLALNTERFYSVLGSLHQMTLS